MDADALVYSPPTNKLQKHINNLWRDPEHSVDVLCVKWRNFLSVEIICNGNTKDLDVKPPCKN